jgi:hypothetical protein
MATAADAAVGKILLSNEKGAFELAKAPFCFCSDKDTGWHLMSGHIFPVYEDTDIYTN